jgi:AcrR family transcriptional regulator
MRTHHSHAAGVIPESGAGDPAVVAGPPAVPAMAPNTRVAPARRGGPPGGWDCDVDQEPEPDGDATAPDGDATAPGGDATAPDGKDTAARRPGRPRSERAEQAILRATIEAIGERGIDGVHCEDVAARAGVGKATLYRRWPGKEDLLIAAFAAMRRPLPQPRGESAREDLIALLTVVAADADDPRYAQQYALLHGAGERYPRLVARYKERVVEPRRELVRAVLRHGIETGELRQGTDVEVAMLLLTGAVMVRGKHDATPAAPGFVERAVDELLRGIANVTQAEAAAAVPSRTG